MAHGESTRPIEVTDGKAVAPAVQANTEHAILVVDPQMRESLLACERHLETIATLLQLVVGGGDSPHRS